MDPFRDELAAAHAKIAQLEIEVRTLKGDHYPPPATDSVPTITSLRRRDRIVMSILLGSICVVVLGLVFAVLLFVSRAAPPTSSVTPGARAASSSR
jgi:hypothetical protein